MRNLGEINAELRTMIQSMQQQLGQQRKGSEFQPKYDHFHNTGYGSWDSLRKAPSYLQYERPKNNFPSR